MKNEPTAQIAYMAAAADISGMVSELQVMADKLHDVSPDGIDWGNVGDLKHIREALADVLSTVKNNG